MTVAIPDSSIIYQGNEVTTIFPYSFRIPDPTYAKITLRNSSTHLVIQVLNSGDYDITGTTWDNYDGGTVTYSPAITADVEIVIERVIPILQDLELNNQGGFYADSIEQALDKGAMISQELDNRITELGTPVLADAGNTPESYASYTVDDATQALLDALASGRNVTLSTGITYPYTTSLAATANYQRIGGGGVLRPIGAIDGMQVTGGLVGVELDLTFDAPDHTGTAVRISGANRTRIRRLLCNDVFSVLWVEDANMTTVDYVWGVARGKGLTWYGNDDLRSDVLTIGSWVIDQTAAPTQYGFDWNGNCQTFEAMELGLIRGLGMIIRNVDGVATFPAIGRFHLESDYSQGHGLEILAGLDYDIQFPYILGSNLSGIKVGATINSYEVRITGGKSVGSTTGYGVENAGGPILISGNTALYSNFLGEVLGNAWTRLKDLRLDDTFSINSVGAGPVIGYDTNDYETYDRTNNIYRRYINAVQIVEQAATYLTSKGINLITDQPAVAPFNIQGIETRTLQQVYGSDYVGRVIGRYSNDPKGVTDYAFKTRATVFGTNAATSLGDKVYSFLPYADTGSSMAHIGQEVWAQDAAVEVGATSEIPGAWYIYTCQGQVNGNRVALMASSKQKVLICGPNTAVPAPGTDLGAVLTLGVGAAAPKSAPLKFTLASAVLNTVAEAGAMEADTSGVYYLTDSSAVRKRIITMGTPTTLSAALSTGGAETNTNIATAINTIRTALLAAGIGV